MDATRRWYEEHAAEYVRNNHATDLAALRRRLTERLAPGARIADLGCGSGRDLAAFRAEGFAAVGLDLAAALLAHARTAGAPLVQGDLAALPFARAAFDGLWICASLLHVPRALAPTALAEVARVLAPDGIAVLSLKERAPGGPAEISSDRRASRPPGAEQASVGRGPGRSPAQNDERRFVLYEEDEAAGLCAQAGLEPLARTVEPGPAAAAPRWLTLVLRRG